MLRTTPKLERASRYPRAMTDLEAAWAAVHENTPKDWYVGKPMEHPERNEWSPFACDPSKTPIVGKRSREWTAIEQTELHCVQTDGLLPGRAEAGRWPK